MQEKCLERERDRIPIDNYQCFQQNRIKHAAGKFSKYSLSEIAYYKQPLNCLKLEMEPRYLFPPYFVVKVFFEFST